MNVRRFTTIVLLAGLAKSAFAQTPEVSIEEPKPVPLVNPLLRPFHIQARIVAPARLTDSPRLESLVRAGNLYLSAQDVIALVLENNVDVAIQRYGPPLAREVVRRAQAGAALRSVGQSISPGPISVSTTGVTVNPVGLAGGGSGVSSGGGLVTQYGEIPPNLDPYLLLYGNFAHASTPESNTAVSLIPALVNSSQTYEIQYGQAWTTGTSAALTFYNYHSSVNSPANALNPYTSGLLDLYVTQNLLQGWGNSVNNRWIRMAKNNEKVTELQLELQVITTVSAVLNLYWDLVSFDQDLRIKEKALETAMQFLDDDKRLVELGTLPGIEVTRAEAEVSATKEDLLIAQTNVAQQETVLKSALSRNGAVDASMDDVHIVPLEQIVIPDKEDLKPTAELVEEALAGRPEIKQARTNLASTKANLAGTKNNLLPTLQAFVELTNNGLSGTPNALNANGAFGPAAPEFVGSYGNLLGQIAKRKYPNYSAGFSLNIPFRNRAAQADYVADLLTLRQSELQIQKAASQVRVDVKNAVIGLQQARARYEIATATRVLAMQTLEAEQQRFRFGESSVAAIVQAERDLAGDQSDEIHAMANYTHATIAFDQAVGQTLEVNHIAIDEARSGRVARQSSIPEITRGGVGETR